MAAQESAGTDHGNIPRFFGGTDLSDTNIANGNVVVNRAMSLDGFIAGPGHSMDWGDGRHPADFVAPDDVAEIAAATGAMLIGRRTWEVGNRMEADDPGSTD